MFLITSDCVKCAMCVDSCPVSAIIEGDEQYVITDACIDCGDCIPYCPVDSIRGI